MRLLFPGVDDCPEHGSKTWRILVRKETVHQKEEGEEAKKEEEQKRPCWHEE